MLLELTIALILAWILGTITGLTPGLHLNTVALLTVALSPFLLQFTSLQILIVFIMSMSIIHTFVDAIPSIYLGVPDESQVLSVLPGHKMLLNGEGHNALKLTIIGSFFSLLLSIILIPFLIPLVKIIYPIIKNYIGWLLVVVMSFMILKDKMRYWNFILFMLSGILGLIVLNMPNINNVLFPLLSGLFGFSILLISLKNKASIPKQDLTKKLNVKKSTILKSTIGATIAGFIASFLPGLGSSQAAILAQQFMRKIKDDGFLILIGGINTVNMALSLVTLYAIDKARNGAVVAISQIAKEFNLQFLLVSIAGIIITGGVAVFLSLKISKIFSKIISKINYQKLIIFIMSFVAILVFYFGGFLGLFILLVSTSIGLVASLKGVGKNHLMGCLIFPVILFFLL